MGVIFGVGETHRRNRMNREEDFPGWQDYGGEG